MRFFCYIEKDGLINQARIIRRKNGLDLSFKEGGMCFLNDRYYSFDLSSYPVVKVYSKFIMADYRAFSWIAKENVKEIFFDDSVTIELEQ